MKKYILALALFSFLLNSCQKDETQPALSKTKKNTLAKTITATMEGVGTKATEDNGSFAWQKGDSIAVYTVEGKWAKFFLSLGAGRKMATFEVVPGHEGLTAKDLIISPMYLINSASTNLIDTVNKTFKVTLPKYYTYSEGNINSPMYAYSPNGDMTNLSFKHLGAVLKISYKNVPNNARTLRVCSYGNKVTGEFMVNYSGTEPKIETTAATTDYVYVRFKESDIKENMTFYIPIPLGNYTKFTLDFMNESNVGINSSYGSFDRNNMKGGGKGSLDVTRRALVTLPSLRGSNKTDLSYSIQYQGINANGKALIKFIVPYGTKYNTHVISKTAYEHNYGADPARVINRYYFYSLNLASNTATYAYTADLTQDDYICIMAGHEDDGYQNPNGFYAIEVIPRLQQPTAAYSAWLGKWLIKGVDSYGTPLDHEINIEQVVPNRTFCITGWAPYASSTLHTWKIMADYDESNDAIYVRNTLLYSYSGIYPHNSGKYDGYAIACGVYEKTLSSYQYLAFAWPKCSDFAAKILKNAPNAATMEGIPNFYDGKPSETIAYYLTTVDGAKANYLGSLSAENYIRFPASLSR